MARGDPLDGQVLMVAAAKASVPLGDLPELVDRAQADLGPRFETYRRSYEAVYESPERWVFLVPLDHWESVGARLDFSARQVSAVQRAHEEQLRRIGGDEGRREEFENALDIRSAVVVGVPDAAEGDGEPEGENDDERDLGRLSGADAA